VGGVELVAEALQAHRTLEDELQSAVVRALALELEAEAANSG
jgi:hypothetical protein